MKLLPRHVATLCKDIKWAILTAADFSSCYRLSLDFMLTRLMRVTPLPPSNRLRRCRLRGGTKISYRLNRADTWTIHEIWVEAEYQLPPQSKLKVIVDIGANIGLTSLWLARRYGCALLIAVEPAVSNAKLARLNFASNKIAAQVLEAAVGAHDGTAVFDSGASPTNGRVVNALAALPDPQMLPATQLTIPLLSMNSVLANLPDAAMIDLLKVDIEGGEQELLSGDVAWLTRVRTIIIEFHPTLVDYPQLLAVLHQAGFTSNYTGSVDASHVQYFVRQTPQSA